MEKSEIVFAAFDNSLYDCGNLAGKLHKSDFIKELYTKDVRECEVWMGYG